MKCKSVLRTCCNPDSSSSLFSLSINFVITCYAGFHKKSVPSVAATFLMSYPCSKSAWHTTFSYDSRARVIDSADLWSVRTMNSDWTKVSSNNLLEFPKKFWKVEITWMNYENTAIKHITEDTVFTIN